MTMPVDDMQHALEGSDTDTNLPPGHWGDMRQHVFYGALYHWFVMFANRKYRNFRPIAPFRSRANSNSTCAAFC